jgi:hypothetical protein
VPASLREILDARLATLTDRVGATLLAAALLSRPTVSAAVTATGDHAQADLQAAADAGVVEVHSDELRFVQLWELMTLR